METIIFKPLNSVWLKASVVGSFWASIEIILGSFLHNLKVPLSGTVLSFISVYLIIAFIQKWKEKGLILRAGLVCALMKSISPSAIILGPMIGILTEAFLLEFFIWLFGRNILGYLIGGGFAVLSALLHKVFNLLILYGLNFIKILSDLYQFAIKQINLSSLDPWFLITIIIFIYMASGFTAAASGYFTGKKYIKNKHIKNDQPYIAIRKENPLFSETTNQKYSVYNLLLNIIAIIISLFIINLDFNYIYLLFPLSYLSFSIYHYKSSLIRFKKISIWIQFALITIIASFLWNGISGSNFFSAKGLIIGLQMISRAVIIIIGFATISIELKNPIIKSVLYKKGFANLYQSVNLAFSALPGIISSLPESKKIFKNAGMVFYNIFNQAENLLVTFEKEHSKHSPVIIITGERHTGKTTFVKKLIENLKKQKISITGFLSIGIDNNGIRSGFKIVGIDSGQEVGLCSNVVNSDWLNFGQYYFNPQGIAFGNEILSKNNLSDYKLVIIDEIGPIELNNKGWNNSIEVICQTSSIPQLWVVRKSLVEKIVKKWNVGNIYIFNIEEDSLNDAENKILEIIKYKS